MEDVIKEVKMAVETFESGNLEVFKEKAVLVYNYFATHPQTLGTIKNTYLVGLFYSYLEGAFRRTILSAIPVENAFYCFAKTMENDMLDWNERQCAAMRIFILMYDNGSETRQIIDKVFKKNDVYLSGYGYHDLPRKRIFELMDFIDHGVKAYCYSIFNSEINSSFLSDSEMHRLKYYVNVVNDGIYPLTKEMGDFSNEGYFNMWYDYLRKEVECDKKNISSLRYKTIDSIDNIPLDE